MTDEQNNETSRGAGRRRRDPTEGHCRGRGLLVLEAAAPRSPLDATRGRGVAEEPAAERPEPRRLRPSEPAAEEAAEEPVPRRPAPRPRPRRLRPRSPRPPRPRSRRRGAEGREEERRDSRGRPGADRGRAGGAAERRGEGPRSKPRKRRRRAARPRWSAATTPRPRPRAAPRRRWRAAPASSPPANASARSPASPCCPATARSKSTSAASRSSSRVRCTRRWRRQPLTVSGYEGNVDVRVRVHGGGISGQAGAVRHGIARALTEIDPELRGELKRRGFLTRDARVKERRKAGFKKARKKPQFSKR